MKKILSLLAAFGLILIMSACSNDNEPDNPSSSDASFLIGKWKYQYDHGIIKWTYDLTFDEEGNIHLKKTLNNPGIFNGVANEFKGTYKFKKGKLSVEGVCIDYQTEALYGYEYEAEAEAKAYIDEETSKLVIENMKSIDALYFEGQYTKVD